MLLIYNVQILSKEFPSRSKDFRGEFEPGNWPNSAFLLDPPMLFQNSEKVRHY